jgi:probable HAF family extracellular repeat protein
LQLNLGPSVGAEAISGDGNVVIGEQLLVNAHFIPPSPGTARVIRWTKADGAQTIGVIPLPAYWMAMSIDIQTSRDGSAVMGNLVDTNLTGKDISLRPFRWTKDGGMQDLGKKSGDRSTQVECLSSDGSVCAGEDDLAARIDPKFYPGPHYFRWTQRRGFEDLGIFSVPGSSLTVIRGISDDGAVVTGTFNFPVPKGNHAFRWTQAGGIQDLGKLGGQSAWVIRASPDGTALIAAVKMADNTTHVVRWTQTGGPHDLGFLGNQYASPAYASEDGSVVVGDVQGRPFRWTSASGLQYIWNVMPHRQVDLIGVKRDGSKVVVNVGPPAYAGFSALWQQTENYKGSYPRIFLCDFEAGAK